VSVDRAYPIRQILVALVVLPALYLDFNIYRTGNIWVALAMLVVIGLGAYVYLSKAGYTYRYLFPGFLGFGLFVIFPIVYMVFLSFTKYSSQNLLYFDRSLALLQAGKLFGGRCILQIQVIHPGRWEICSLLRERK